MNHQNDKPKPADLSHLMAELRRVSTDPAAHGKMAFWHVLRWHLRHHPTGPQKPKAQRVSAPLART